jgi:hypothetical protein
MDADGTTSSLSQETSWRNKTGALAFVLFDADVEQVPDLPKRLLRLSF